MEKRELICIGCPKGCALTVTLENQQVVQIEGNTCKRGAVYAEKECTNPTRTVTTTVPVRNGKIPMVSVRTESDIPKCEIFSCMKELRKVWVEAPVRIGDVILADAAGTGINVIATKNVERIGRGVK